MGETLVQYFEAIKNRRLLTAVSLLVLLLVAAIALPYAKRISQRFTGSTHPASPVSTRSTETRAVVPDTLTKRQAQQQSLTPQALGPIDHYVIAGGGGTSTGGTFTETGTVGEVSASNPQIGGSYSLNGGFWNTVSATTAATPTPSPTPTPSGSPTPTPTPTATPPPNAVQFEQSSYSVVEDCTSVTIAVNRIGDTSTAVSVDYFTSDVTASERRNYITAIGTLH